MLPPPPTSSRTRAAADQSPLRSARDEWWQLVCLRPGEPKTVTRRLAVDRRSGSRMNRRALSVRRRYRRSSPPPAIAPQCASPNSPPTNPQSAHAPGRRPGCTGILVCWCAVDRHRPAVNVATEIEAATREVAAASVKQRLTRRSLGNRSQYRAEPKVRIHFPPPANLRTLGPSRNLLVLRTGRHR